MTNVLTLLTTDENDVESDIPVTIEAYLVNYPYVVSETTFLVTILPCEITSLTASTTPDKEYQIFNPGVSKTIASEPFIKFPNCASDVTYTF